MKIFILKKFFAATIMLAALCVSCSDDDGPKNPAEALSITIKADGSTSTGAKFTPASNDSFFLDYVLYQIVDSHIEVIGYDKSEIKGDIKVYSPINYFGVTYNVRSIADGAFSRCGTITSVNLPDCINYIGEQAFNECSNLKSINLPSELPYISRQCFDDCKKLNDVILPQGIEFIGGGAFGDCANIGKVILPEGITTIGGYAFSGCGNLGDLNIPSSCKEIGGGAFEGCSFTNLTIENGVEYVCYEAFANCKIKNVILPSSLIYRDYPGFSYADTEYVFQNSDIDIVRASLSHWSENERKYFFMNASIKELIIN